MPVPGMTGMMAGMAGMPLQPIYGGYGAYAAPAPGPGALAAGRAPLLEQTPAALPAFAPFPMQMPAPLDPPPAAADPRAALEDGSTLLWYDEGLSIEEARARLPQYHCARAAATAPPAPAHAGATS